MTPRYARWIVIAAAAVAVLVAAAGRGDPEPRAAEPELVLRYLYSTDADDLLEPLIARYNRESHRLGRREVRIDGFALASGQAEAALAAGDERAALWTPASSLWAGLLNHHVSAKWVPDGEPVNLVYSPQVIAMWKPFARALGWPRAEIGWKEILALTTSSRGWAEYGREEYGPFLLGHTNPGYSTSGLSAVASHYYALTGKRSGLSLAEVRRPSLRAAVQKLERSIVHQGETASRLIAKMLRYGEPYAHAVYVQETTLRGLKPSQAARLTWIKPADGTFVADYPLIVLAAPWVSSNARAAADTFRRWLRPKITAEHAAASNFEVRRPTGLAELQPPEPEVLAAIQDAWHEDRKPANIVLVVDTSNSMATDRRLAAAKQGLMSFLRALSPQDRVALVTSGGQEKVPLGVLGKRKQAVFSAVSGLFARGDEPIYAAVSKARDSLRTRNDPERINAVVVLSDGAGTSVGSQELLLEIDSDPVTEGTSVRIFTVAYGQPPKRSAEALKQIALESDGLFFTGGPKDINAVYQKILSYF